MVKLGTALTPTAVRVLFCGGGELGKEVVIELQRLGVEVIAVDRYAHAPAMQVAHRSYMSSSMLDGAALRRVIELERPHYIVPEIEAIATDTLVELEREGFTVIPTARAAQLTMNREGIRRLAAEELGLPTSPYRFADDPARSSTAPSADIGLPCVVKPIMSSSGKGQSLLRDSRRYRHAWRYAQEGGRAAPARSSSRASSTSTTRSPCSPCATPAAPPSANRSATVQVDGDYRESWQPQPMTPTALARARDIAEPDHRRARRPRHLRRRALRQAATK